MITRTGLLETFAAECDTNTTFARLHFSDLEEDQFNWRYRPLVWSIAQCIQHLNMTGTHWLRQFEKIPKKKLKAGTPDKFQPGILSKYLLKIITPEAKIKLKSPAIFIPHHLITGKVCLEEFYEVQERLKSYSVKFSQADISSGYLIPPNFSFIHVNIGEALMLHNRHVKRHLLQALQIKKHILFPQYS
ncbi:MAG: DinB family protein [Bacteroidia bacterium]|nr:DinB family protein [Bacteroidia bacterium]